MAFFVAASECLATSLPSDIPYIALFFWPHCRRYDPSFAGDREENRGEERGKREEGGGKRENRGGGEEGGKGRGGYHFPGTKRELGYFDI